MARHATMPPRIQKTPYGDATLASRIKRNRFYLTATGTQQTLHWLFPKHNGHFENIHASTWRHVFTPSNVDITVERELRRVCAHWQENWNSRLQDHLEGHARLIPQQVIINTLNDLVRHVFELRKVEISPKTSEKNRNYLQQWTRVLGGDIPLHHITEGVLRTARSQLLLKCKASTVNDSMAVLRAYLTWAHANGYMSELVHKNIKKLPVPKNHNAIIWWTPEEVNLALRCAREDKHQPTALLMVAMGCLLGLRYEEMVMQRWQDLDLDARDISGPTPVCHVVPHDGWTPKDKEARTIPIHENLHAILLQHRQPSGYLLTPQKVYEKRGGTIRVYRYDPAAVWVRITDRIVATGGKRISCHAMRHSFASNLLQAQVSDSLIADWMGHADTTLIHERYGHLLAYHRGINAVKFATSAPVPVPVVTE